MPDLAALLTERMRDGRIRAVTIWPCEAGWQANVQRPDGSWSCSIDADPTVALSDAIEPRVFRRTGSRPIVPRFEDLLG